MNRRRALQRLGFYGGLLVLGVFGMLYMTAMPVSSHQGPPARATTGEIQLAHELRTHVAMLADTIGERRVGHSTSLARAQRYLMSELEPAIPAVMVSDTAVFRDPHYHQPQDQLENLDSTRMARVATDIERVVETLTAGP